MLFPLRIRHKRIFVIAQLIMAMLLLILSAYTNSLLKVGLAGIWFLIGLNNLSSSILDVTENEIVVRNALGMVVKRYEYKGAEIEVREKQIFINQAKIYKHSFMFVDEDFEKVQAFLASQDPDINLKRHLVED